MATSTATLGLTIDTGDRVVYDLIDPETGMSAIHLAIGQDQFRELGEPEEIVITIESP